MTVTAKGDIDAAPDKATLSHSIRGYDALPADYKAPTVTVNVTDDDYEAIVVDPSEITVMEGNVTGVTYDVTLAAIPVSSWYPGYDGGRGCANRHRRSA